MLRTASSLPLAGLLTLGFDPARFPAEPPACYRASWQLPGPDSHRQATTSLRTRRSTMAFTSWRHLRFCWAHGNSSLNRCYKHDRGKTQDEYRWTWPPEIRGIIAHYDDRRNTEPCEQRYGRVADRGDPPSEVTLLGLLGARSAHSPLLDPVRCGVQKSTSQSHNVRSPQSQTRTHVGIHRKRCHKPAAGVSRLVFRRHSLVQPCGCRISCRPTRPGHIRGSGHPVGPAKGPGHSCS